MTTVTTIHLIDQPGGGITVCTTAGTPHPGQRLTPGQALATDLLRECTHRASDVRYWQGHDKAMAFVLELSNPEGLGYADKATLHAAAQAVLGRPMAWATRPPPASQRGPPTLQCPPHHWPSPRPPLRPPQPDPITSRSNTMPEPKTTTAPSHQGRSASGKVPGAGLHSISTTGKRYGPTEATVALAVPSYAPHCASTTPTGYTCPELTRAPVRAGACDAFKLPSRSAFTK